MLRIAVPSVLQQSTVSIGMMIVQAVVNPFGTQALAGYAATMRVENVFSLIFVSIGNAVSPYVAQNLGAKKNQRIKKGYYAALVLDLCFALLAFIVIETLHTQISSLFLGKDGTAFAYQVSVSHCKYGKPCDPLVSSFDFCPVFWYCICLAGCTGRLVRQFSDLILGTQEIMAGDKVTKEDE